MKDKIKNNKKVIIPFIIGIAFIILGLIMNKKPLPPFVDINYVIPQPEEGSCVFKKNHTYFCYTDSGEKHYKYEYDSKNNIITFPELNKKEYILYYDENTNNIIYWYQPYKDDKNIKTYIRTTSGTIDYTEFGEEINNYDISTNYNINSKYPNSNSHPSLLTFNINDKTYSYDGIVKGTFKIYKMKYNVFPITIVLNDKNDKSEYFFIKEDGNLYNDDEWEETAEYLKEN